MAVFAAFFGAARPPVMTPSLITGATVVKSACYVQSLHIHFLEDNNIPLEKYSTKHIFLYLCCKEKRPSEPKFEKRTVFVNKGKLTFP